MIAVTKSDSSSSELLLEATSSQVRNISTLYSVGSDDGVCDREFWGCIETANDSFLKSVENT